VDGTNLERNLYLTGELATLDIPFVIAVNMADELEKNNIKLNADKLSELFGVSVVKISAKNGMNTDLLVELARNAKKQVINNDVFVHGTEEERYSFISKKLENIIK
jgi:ferrous iron transport protein B